MRLLIALPAVQTPTTSSLAPATTAATGPPPILVPSAKTRRSCRNSRIGNASQAAAGCTRSWASASAASQSARTPGRASSFGRVPPIWAMYCSVSKWMSQSCLMCMLADQSRA